MRHFTTIFAILLFWGCKQIETDNSREYNNLMHSMKLSYELMDINLMQKSVNYPEKFKVPYELVTQTNHISEKAIELIDSYGNSESKYLSKLQSELKNTLDSLNLILNQVEKLSPTRTIRINGQKLRVKTSDPSRNLLAECYKMLDNSEEQFKSKIDLLKLSLTIIDLEVKKALTDKLYSNDFKMNYFRPILVDNGNKYDFYFTATDTLLETKIVIEDSSQNEIVKVKNAHAVIDKKKTIGKKMVFSIRLPDGTTINQPLK